MFCGVFLSLFFLSLKVAFIAGHVASGSFSIAEHELSYTTNSDIYDFCGTNIQNLNPEYRAEMVPTKGRHCGKDGIFPASGRKGNFPEASHWVALCP